MVHIDAMGGGRPEMFEPLATQASMELLTLTKNEKIKGSRFPYCVSCQTKDTLGILEHPNSPKLNRYKLRKDYKN